MTTRGRSRPEPDVHAPPMLPRTTRDTRHPSRAPPSTRDEEQARSRLGTRFAQTPDFTLGVEEELVLVDPEDGSLVDRPAGIEQQMAASDGELQTEIFRSTVEAATPVCADLTDVAAQMRRLRASIVQAAEDHGLAAVATGTHPFARWEAQTTSQQPRYERLVAELQLPARSDLVFGQHVHVSVGSPEEAIHVTNAIGPHLPLLLALSANAPFWRGIDSGLQSARTSVSAGMPRSGLPPAFADWSAFKAHMDTLRQAGSIEDVTKIWWDVRPRADLGTVEVRIADLPTEIETSTSLAALTHALVVHLAKRARREEQAPLPHQPGIVAENRWRALRDGVHAEFIDAGRDEVRVRSVEEVFARLVDRLAPTIQCLGVGDEIAHLRRRIDRRRSGADRQRRIYERDADLGAVVQDLAARTPP